MKRLSGFWNWLTLPGGRLIWSQTVHLGSIPKDQAGLHEILSGSRNTKPIDFVLTDRLVLRKTHVLPREARKQAANILKLRSDSLSSASQSDLTAAYLLKRRGHKDDVYEQYLARTADLDTLQHLCAEAGAPLRSISVEANQQHIIFVDQKPDTDRAISRWWIAATAAAVLVCLMALYGEFNVSLEKQQQLTALRAELGELQQRLDAAANTGSTNAAEEARLSGIVETIAAQQQTSAMLQKLTTNLSDEVWLSELVMFESQLRMSGVSSVDPISVIAALETEAWVASVALARPVRTDSLTQLSNFELLIELEASAL